MNEFQFPTSQRRTKPEDGYVAYPLGLKGVVGRGDGYEEALADVKSAIAFHLETFGGEVVESKSAVLEASAIIPALFYAAGGIWPWAEMSTLVLTAERVQAPG